METKFYLRYSQDIEKDIKNGVSYHYTDCMLGDSVEDIEAATGLSIDQLEYNEDARVWAYPLAGLCAFELDADNLEDAIEEAKNFYMNSVYNSKDMPFFHILTGDYAPENSAVEGCCIKYAEVVYSNKY